MRLTPCLVAGAFILANGLLGSRCIAADPPANAPRVAVADVVRIFNENQRTKDLKNRADNDSKALENERIARAAKINDLRAQRDQLNQNAPDWGKLNTEVLQQTLALKNWIDFQKLEMDRMQKQQIKDVFDLITAAIAKYAAANKIDIVISSQQPELPPNLDQIDINQLRLGLIQRSVLYTGEQWDITNAVIAIMDQDFKSGK